MFVKYKHSKCPQKLDLLLYCRIYTISLSDGKVSLGLITDMGGLELPLVHMALTNTNILTAYVDSAAPRVLSCQYESTASILNWSEANLQVCRENPKEFTRFGSES